MASLEVKGDGVLKAARARCYKARDQFYNCVEEQQVVFSLDQPIPNKCTAQRQEFERACKHSWVKHFDLSHDKQLRLLKTLKDNINKSEATATGTLAGKVQD